MLNHREQFTCPACGGYIGEAASIEFVAERLPKGQQTAIFNLLAKRLARPVAKESIIDQLFSDRADGGPESASRVVDTQLAHLRKIVLGYGWMIKRVGGGRGGQCSYQLIPQEAGPC
jgi:hypothetical protein